MRKKLSRELIDIEMKLQDSFTLSSTIQENKAIQAIKRNPKYFFTYIKKFSKTKPSVGPLLNADQQFVVDNKDMADIRSNQYWSVFSTPHPGPINLDEIFNSADNSNLLDFEFSPEDIIKSIDDISMNAAAGPDGFPAIFLKQCKHELPSTTYEGNI